MAITLLINIDDILSRSSLSGNIDTDKIVPHISNAQEIEIIPLLGTQLYDELLELVGSGDINLPTNECYKTLWIDYVTPALVFFTLEYFLPFHHYSIANSGVNQTTGENFQNVSKTEVDSLVQKLRNKADAYAKRMDRYLCDNSTCFPQLCANDIVDKRPAAYRTGLYLGGC